LLAKNECETTWQTIPQPQEGASVSFDLTVKIQTRIEGEKKELLIQEGGFAICYDGKFYAYRNHCPHVGSPLDWIPNQFFSEDKENLICHTHGAIFEPTTGACLSGPCPRGLYPIPTKVITNELQVPTLLKI